jgi:hypothetical protein
MINSILNNIILKSIIKSITIFLITIITLSTIQWSSIQFLSTFCSKWTFLGFFENVVTMGSPMCNFVNHLQLGLSNHYITFWAISAASLVGFIISLFQKI